jgi:hypothetical protein
MRKQRVLTAAIALIAVLAGLGVAYFILKPSHAVIAATASGAPGGTIAAVIKAPGVLQLSSNRFTCASCARRVIPAIRSLQGVRRITFSPFVGISKSGSAPNGLLGTLTVAFDPLRVRPERIALLAAHALESDPYNRGSVAIETEKPVSEGYR